MAERRLYFDVGHFSLLSASVDNVIVLMRVVIKVQKLINNSRR